MTTHPPADLPPAPTANYEDEYESLVSFVHGERRGGRIPDATAAELLRRLGRIGAAKGREERQRFLEGIPGFTPATTAG
jgi:hypothetical protein